MAESNKLKGFYLRASNGESYLIPTGKIESFDTLNDAIDECDEYSDEFYNFTEKFSDLFGSYKMEGNLYNTLFFLDKHPNL